MESWMYNPERAAATMERRERRERKGCSGCKYRGERVFGRYLCRAKQTPDVRGFCKQWQGDEE